MSDQNAKEENDTARNVLQPKGEHGNGVYEVPEATRFEIYGDRGNARVFTLEPGASIHLQDDGRTVKIFTNEHVSSSEWFEKNHDWGKNRSTEEES